MSDWSFGYVSEIDYTYGYYTELNPQRLFLPLLIAGIRPPKVETACELGFGQGISINIHAAASAVTWWGTDFNPAQASFAQELAEISGSGARLFDQSFAEFCQRSDLPDFDFIGLHGIWSWISDENRAIIVDFVRRKLKVGGVLYISYNTQPGWATMVPVRELMVAYADSLCSRGEGIVKRIDATLDFIDNLFSLQPIYLQASPTLTNWLKKMKEQSRHYLAHEYFNRDWHPVSVHSMSQWLSDAKLSYAGSAHYLDSVDAINLSNEQQTFLSKISDPIFREFVRDFFTNCRFRRDYWIKGRRQLGAFERLEALRSLPLLLVAPADSIAMKVTGARGEATLNKTVYEPILNILANHKPVTIGKLEQSLSSKGITLAQVLQAALILVGKADVVVTQEDSTVSKVKKSVERLNNHLMNKSRASKDFSYLASPVTGGGFLVNQIQQLFLLAKKHGKKTPQEWANFAWSHLKALGNRLIKDGKVLETEEENITELTTQANTFYEKQYPILKVLQIIS